MGLTFPGQAPGNDNPYPYGVILFSNIPNQSILANVVTQLVQGTDPHSVVGSSVILPYGHNKGWSFSLSFNDTNDITTLSFSQTPQLTQVNKGFPIVTSSILSFFGFNQRVNLN